jgi:hypothetical protein
MRLWRLAAGTSMAVAGITACAFEHSFGDTEIHAGGNTDRYILASPIPDASSTRRHVCIEPVGPATKLTDTKASLAAGYTGATGSITADQAQTLGTIYAVGDIMQFAQLSLFRLCEAESNGDVDRMNYPKYYAAIMSTTAALLCLQALGSSGSSKQTADNNATSKQKDAEDAGAQKRAADRRVKDVANSLLVNPKYSRLSGLLADGHPPLSLQDLTEITAVARDVPSLSSAVSEATSITKAADATKEAADAAAATAEKLSQQTCAGAMDVAERLLGALVDAGAVPAPR